MPYRENLDPPEKCSIEDCHYNSYKKGLCLEHYLDEQESHADQVHDERRDRNRERESDEHR